MGESTGAAVAPTPSRVRARPTGELAPERAAWIGAVPCMAVVALAVALLGPPLGPLLAPTRHYRFFETTLPFVRPEQTEHARFLIALVAPLLLALSVATRARWRRFVPGRADAYVAPIAQALLGVLVLACLVRQHELRFGEIYTTGEVGGFIQVRYFTLSTLAVAAALATVLLVLAARADVRRLAARLADRSSAMRVGLLLVALAITAVWLLPSIQTDRSVGAANNDVFYHLGFTLDEAFAVINGRTPLVDFSAQYATLWPYATALLMIVLGKTLLVFTLAMTALTTIALIAVYLVLRRVTKSSVAALLLYLPFMATSLFLHGESSANRSTVGNYYANMPLRYAGPYLLAWLTARQLDRRRGAELPLLFGAAGLVLLNNADFGIPALAATVAALLWAAPSRRRATLGRLAASAAIGLVAALALVTTLTLARTGSLPQLGRLTEFSQLYSLGGYALMPLPGVLGMHLLIYLTYVAAIAVATVEAARGSANRVLTGMLAWSGVFGLGTATYYMGRSHPVALMMIFSSWALALALLTWVVVRARAEAARPSIAAFLVLLGFGVAACSLAQLSPPWTQLERLSAPFVPSEEVPFASPLVPPERPTTRAFVASLADGPSRFVVRRGAPVAILLTTGHRIADAYGIRNVSPLTGTESMHTIEAVDDVVAALRRAGGNTVILPRLIETPLAARLQQLGFRVVTSHGLGTIDPRAYDESGLVLMPWNGSDAVLGNPDAITKWVDTRNLHPRALE